MNYRLVVIVVAAVAIQSRKLGGWGGEKGAEW